MKNTVVIMSTYNASKYLREQLDSLVEQSVKPYKIVIRDDGSTDNTVAIIEEYRNELPENYRDENDS